MKLNTISSLPRAAPLLTAVMLAASSAVGGPDAAAAPPAARAGEVADPVYLGWDRGCVVYRYLPGERRWASWKGPKAFLPGRLVTAVGPRAAVALDPAAGYGGWLFDLNAEKWTVVPPSPVAVKRGAFAGTAVAFVGGKLVVWGAFRPGGKERNDVLQGAGLDLATLRWQALPEAPVVGRYRCLTGVIGTKLLVWGGYGWLDERMVGPLDDGAVYDVETGAWTKMPAPPVAGHRYGASGVVCEGRFVVVGGRDVDGFRRDVVAFDPGAGRWESLPELPVDVGVNGAAAAAGDKLFVWSGARTDRGSGETAEGAVYDLWTRKWEKLPEAPVAPRQLAFARCSGDTFSVWGGWLEGRGPEFQMDGARYDWKKRAWEAMAELPGDAPAEMHPGW